MVLLGLDCLVSPTSIKDWLPLRGCNLQQQLIFSINPTNGTLKKKRDQREGSIWSEMWKSLRIENGEMMEKWKDRKDFIFPRLCLVARVKK